jgi:hypothetical protein
MLSVEPERAFIEIIITPQMGEETNDECSNDGQTD